MDSSLVARVRQDMKTQGWSLVDTRQIVELHPPQSKYSFYAHYGGRRETYSGDILEDTRLADFIMDLTDCAVYDEDIGDLSALDVRVQASTHYDQVIEEDNSITDWHADGGYIRAITAVSGKCTEYKPSRDSEEIRSIPEGHTLIFTAETRQKDTGIPATLHRMPEFYSDRVLCVFSFWHGNR